MDDLLDFFDKNKPVARKIIPGGTTNGRLKYEKPETSTNRRDDFSSSSNYAEKHIAANNEQLINVNDLFFSSHLNNMIFIFHNLSIFRDAMNPIPTMAVIVIR